MRYKASRSDSVYWFPRFRPGGPQKVSGIDMRVLHTGMDISEEEFNAVVSALSASLRELKVPNREQGEVLNALGPLKDQIVARPISTMERLDTLEASLARIEYSGQSSAGAAREGTDSATGVFVRYPCLCRAKLKPSC